MNAPAAITIATATALAIAWAVPARGAPSLPRLYKGHAIIDVVGTFEPGDSDRFMATVEATPRATMVVFNSRGGQVNEGEAIGAIIGITISQPASPLAVNARPPASRMGGRRTEIYRPRRLYRRPQRLAAEMNEDDVAQRLDGIGATRSLASGCAASARPTTSSTSYSIRPRSAYTGSPPRTSPLGRSRSRASSTRRTPSSRRLSQQRIA